MRIYAGSGPRNARSSSAASPTFHAGLVGHGCVSFEYCELYVSKFFVASRIKRKHIGGRQLALQVRNTVVQLKNGGVGLTE